MIEKSKKNVQSQGKAPKYGLTESSSRSFCNWEWLRERTPLSTSIDDTLPVPPASAEDTQMMPLNPTIQLLDLLSQILLAEKSSMLDVVDCWGIKVQK